MKIEKDEILHIANLANLKLKEEEIETYAGHLEEILNFADIVNNSGVEDLEETIGITGEFNVFRKDEVAEFQDQVALLQNAHEVEQNMFRIPKVIN